jgi:hypothetical protein
MADEKIVTGETKKTETEITPEEKLFRLIAAAGKEDAELQDLLARYAQPKKKSFLNRAGAERITASPVLRIAALTFLGMVTFYFLSGIQVGRTFYMSPGGRLGEVGIEHATDFFPKFFTQQRTALPPEASVFSVSNPPVFQNSAMVIPVKEDRPFRLVGISWDGQGRVAMVEAGQDYRAKFVRQGDILSGNVRVEEVKDYSIVLSSGKKTWELS